MTITIRHIEPTDYEAIHQIVSSPSVYPQLLQLPFPSLEMWRKRLADPPAGLYSLVACSNDEVIGQVGLQTFPGLPRRQHAAALGMAVRDDHHGNGVGTALVKATLDLADHWLALRRIELEVYTDNKAAIRLYEKYGFVTEGTAKSYAFREGQLADVLLMARVR